MLLETDSANPDTYKTCHPYEHDGLVCGIANLDVSDGWIEMVNMADRFPGHYLMINSAARSNTGIEKYGMTLRETLNELNRELVTFWLINRQRDSIELLRRFLNVFPDALVHVCRNLYFGTPEKFELYNGSKARQHIEKRGRTLDFPDLGNRVAVRLYCERLPVSLAISQLPIGDRAELRRWKNACAEMFKTALGER